MLRNVIEDFLERVTERELDLPLLLLLPAMGFCDVHLTHGSAEYGKDIIAKREVRGKVLQYTFQSKVGDIGQAMWRGSIMGQINEAIYTSLAHPNFASELPHQVILVTTGELKGNARTSMQDFNKELKRRKRRPVEFWGRQNLAEYFEQHGLGGIHFASIRDLPNYAQFFDIYAKSLQGDVSPQEIEQYSRRWMDEAAERGQRLLRCAIEAEIIIQQLIAHGLVYEGLFAHLTVLRTLCASIYDDGEDDFIISLYREAVARSESLARSYFNEIRSQWLCHRDLLRLEPLPMNTYLAQCARIVETTCFLYFVTEDNELREGSAHFLEEFLRGEPGCIHPMSNRYSITIALAALVLCNEGKQRFVAELIRDVCIWLCDRHEQGIGLASVEATEETETLTLLAYPIEDSRVPVNSSSLLATCLVDLAAFLAGPVLYEQIVNEVKACHVHPEYWQPKDTRGVCRFDGEDVVAYPNIDFADTLSDFSKYRTLHHMSAEPCSFMVARAFGNECLIALMIVLRDRYFPKMWQHLAVRHVAGTPSDYETP